MKVKIFELYPDGRKADHFIELDVADINNPIKELFAYHGFTGQFAALNYFRTRRDETKRSTFINYPNDGNKDYWVAEDAN